MVTIQDINALEILDSRGNPTVEVQMTLSDETRVTASVPSGASVGAYEAVELRDGDPSRYGGKGVLKAVHNVTTVLKMALIGKDPHDQKGLDTLMREIDGTPNKKQLGANAILGVSLALARAAAASDHIPLYHYLRSLAGIADQNFSFPVPLINVVNGGMHADSNLDIQEYWVIPERITTFRERLRQGSELFHTLGSLFKAKGIDTDVGDEGGYAPNFESNRAVFDILLTAIEKTHLTAGHDVFLGFDAGASVLFDADSQIYHLELDGGRYTSDEFIAFYLDLLKHYPIRAVEDPLAEEEWEGWKVLTAKMKHAYPKVQLIGDDLFVTNVQRVQRGIDGGVANSVLIKPNQIGTVSETLDCIALAHAHHYTTVISHRSGYTIDTFIADLSVAVNSEYIKTGSVSRGERIANYNRLLEIEQELHG